MIIVVCPCQHFSQSYYIYTQTKVWRFQNKYPVLMSRSFVWTLCPSRNEILSTGLDLLLQVISTIISTNRYTRYVCSDALCSLPSCEFWGILFSIIVTRKLNTTLLGTMLSLKGHSCGEHYNIWYNIIMGLKFKLELELGYVKGCYQKKNIT